MGSRLGRIATRCVVDCAGTYQSLGALDWSGMAKGDFQRKVEEAQRKLGAWAIGRNGADDLSSACTNVAVVLVVVNLVSRNSAFAVVALLLLAYSWYRISSKDVARRRSENAEAARRVGPVLSWLANPVAAAREARMYKHLTCPSCGQRVRIPRGKGKVRVTCPRCHARFDGRA